MGAAPIERLTEPSLVQPGENAKTPKPVRGGGDTTGTRRVRGIEDRQRLTSSHDTYARSTCLFHVLQEIKLPWKRYICFSHDAALLGPDIKPIEFDALLNIWVSSSCMTR
jgi:hypothetical protein